MTKEVEQELIEYIVAVSVINITTNVGDLVKLINRQNIYRVTSKDIKDVQQKHENQMGVAIIDDLIVNYMFLIDEKFTEEVIDHLVSVDLDKASKEDILMHGRVELGPASNSFRLLECFVRYIREKGLSNEFVKLDESHIRQMENIISFFRTGEVDYEMLDEFDESFKHYGYEDEYDEFDEYIDEDDDFDFDVDDDFDTRMTLMRSNSYVISVSLGTGCYRHIQINGNSTLEELHQVILDAFEFDDDHAHAFFMTNREWDTQGAFYASFLEDMRRYTSDYILNHFDFEKGDKFKYVFDFGDNWVFQCKILREENSVVESPVVLKSVGVAPLQYGYDED